jgi:hypothetical protein
MVYPPATSEVGARRPAIIQLEQFKEASSKPAQLYAFSIRLVPTSLSTLIAIVDELGISQKDDISVFENVSSFYLLSLCVK